MSIDMGWPLYQRVSRQMYTCIYVKGYLQLREWCYPLVIIIMLPIKP
jgi:hypothetical protein